jgi:hypothetical protein
LWGGFLLHGRLVVRMWRLMPYCVSAERLVACGR